MKILYSLEELQQAKNEYSSKATAFVPTMGALHQGHLSLINKAHSLAGIVIVSIFVNPLQFGPNEDFSKYPRTLEQDLSLLGETNLVDYVFCPSFSIEDLQKIKKVKASPELANILCGKFRPRHFDGVCSIVNYFFELIEPDYAVFGEKDYQQLKIIESMVQDLSLKVKIIGAPIIREDSGLALSSRNAYLDAEMKKKAAEIYKNLRWAVETMKAGSHEKTNEVFHKVQENLCAEGFSIDYLESHWERILIAVRIAGIRLIDNVSLQSQAPTVEE